MPELRTVKLIVGAMSVTIIVMFALVIWGMTRKTDALQVAVSETDRAAAWETRIPAGRILAVTAAGANLGILAQIGPDRVVYVYDARDSRLIGTIRGESLATTAGVGAESPSQLD
jgi:hypothetical protein